MKASELRRKLEGALEQGEARGYLGMSQIGKCPRWLYNQLMDPHPSHNLKFLQVCHEGLLCRTDILNRLIEANIQVGLWPKAIVAPFDDRFQGHILGTVDGDILEIKSMERDRFADMLERGAPFEHLDQCQAYMRYGGYQRTLIVYKCRDTGELYVYEVHRSEHHGERIEQKAKMILAALDSGQPPECTCGRCR